MRTGDTGPPVGFDSGPPLGFDTGPPVGFDSGPPVGFDAGFDSGPPVGFDSGLPVGFDSGGTDPVAFCLSMATNACEMCTCNTCQSQLQACENDAGCRAMRDCGRMTGCRGQDCYGDGIFTNGPCKGVIDANGGPFGGSANIASSLNDCAVGSCGC